MTGSKQEGKKTELVNRVTKMKLKPTVIFFLTFSHFFSLFSLHV